MTKQELFEKLHQLTSEINKLNNELLNDETFNELKLTDQFWEKFDQARYGMNSCYRQIRKDLK